MSGGSARDPKRAGITSKKYATMSGLLEGLKRDTLFV